MNTKRETTPRDVPGVAQRALHLFALVQIGVAYPLFDLLSRYPEFFVARQSQPIDIWLFVLVVSVGLPAVLFGAQLLAYRVDRRLGWLTHLLMVALLFLMLGLSVLSKVVDHSAALILSLAFCLLMTVLYWRTRVGGLFVTFLAPAIVLVPGLFLLNGNISSLLKLVEPELRASDSGTAPGAPIIFVVFDELPTFALLNDEGHIDAGLYPNLSALADTAYWFRNATTVATSTVLAIPPILTGQFPDRFAMPHQGEYPDNLFTWLGEDYDLNVQEAVSVLCPRALCGTGRLPATRSRLRHLLLDSVAIYLNIVASGLVPGELPIVTQSWEDFWGSAEPGGQMYEHRLLQLDDFVERIRVTEKPGLDFIHVNFPHIPYEYLPSGRRYPEGWLMPGLNFATDVWIGTEWQSQQAYHRFVMQLRALDGWLGTLLQRLRSLGLFERSLIVITADHGVSFAPGASRRDTPPLENLESSILPVPLIIKAPYQSEGVVSPRNAETIDIIPTLAELLHRPVTWRIDGTSLLGEAKAPLKRAVHSYKGLLLYETNTQGTEGAILESARRAATAKQGGFSIWPPTREEEAVLGRPVAELAVRHDDSMDCVVPDLHYFRSVSLESGFLPAHVHGAIRLSGDESVSIAIALNGLVVAVTRSYLESETWKFSAMLPESAFRNGDNSLEIFKLGPNSGAQPVVTFLGPRIEREAEEWLLVDNNLTHGGVPLTIDHDGIQGRIDYVSMSGESIEIFGWAIDAAERRTVKTLLVFDGTHLVYQGETRMLREETHQFGVVIKVGFHAVVPAHGAYGNIGTDLRVFAVTTDGRVKEIGGNHHSE